MISMDPIREKEMIHANDCYLNSSNYHISPTEAVYADHTNAHCYFNIGLHLSQLSPNSFIDSSEGVL